MKILIVLLCLVFVGCGDTILATYHNAEPSEIYIHYVYDSCRDSLTFDQEAQYLVDCNKRIGRIFVYFGRTRQNVPSTEGCIHTWKVMLVTPDVDFTMRQIQQWFDRHNIQVIVGKECVL